MRSSLARTLVWAVGAALLLYGCVATNYRATGPDDYPAAQPGEPASPVGSGVEQNP